MKSLTDFLRCAEFFRFDGSFQTVNAFLETQHHRKFQIPETSWSNVFFRWIAIRPFWGEHHRFTFQAHEIVDDPNHTNVKITVRGPLIDLFNM